MNKYDYAANFPNDEPAKKDELGRSEVSHELARIALFCNTPMVIGIYGPWGSGKSTFMEFIKCAVGDQKNLLKDIEQNEVKTTMVQFNPWEAQFVREPALALIEKIARDCKTHTDDDTRSMLNSVKHLFSMVATLASAADAFGMPGASAVGTIAKAGTEMANNQSDVYKKQDVDSLTIQQAFKEIIDKALTKCKAERLIVFIDDLDRCTHEQTLKLLEALKLYLNHEKCVYLVGVDPAAIKASIEHHYRDSTISIKGEDYLDKLIQIPFKLPGVSRKNKNGYISQLLGDDLKICRELMMAGLGDSPRNLKRFSLLLKMNYIVGRTHPGYKPETAALFQLIQWISEANIKNGKGDLFSKISKDRKLILELVDWSADGAKKRAEIIGADEKLSKIFEIAMEAANVPRDIAEVDLYLHLARQDGGVEMDKDESIRKYDLRVVIDKHKEWILSGGIRGEQAHLLREQCAKKDLEALKVDLSTGVNLSQAYLYGIFMEKSNLTGAVLYEAVMEEAALSGIILKGADLRRVNLKGADLKEAKMDGADLRMANLAKADLTKAKLCDAKLFGANLKGTKLTGADLTDADLSNANLLGADLEGAILVRCNLKGAYLAGVKNLDPAQFKVAINWKQCTPPLELKLNE